MTEPDQRPPGEEPAATGPDPEQPPPPGEDAGTTPGTRGRRRRGRVLRLLRRIPHPPWRSRRGLLLIFLIICGAGVAVTGTGLLTVNYTETTSFCGRCHTMGPELKAHDLSVHRNVRCAQCHVKPGVMGFVKAKLNGSKQLVQVLTGTFPRPIPPPDHAALPPVEDTCLECHSMREITRNGGPVQIVLRPTYQSDEKNTRELVAVVLRPVGLSNDATGKGMTGVHWHVQQKVTYTTPESEGVQQIDLVEVARPDGSTDRYISSVAAKGSTDVDRDVARLRAGETSRVMDCLDCHNRTGHGIPDIGQALDESMAAGRISPQLPYVKRESELLLSKEYASDAAADSAITGLRATYRQRYPLVAKQRSAQVDAAIQELRRLYQELATPDMLVAGRTYPDNLGHRNSPGCFRCHDGNHFKVVNGKVTTASIPSTCSTCHTFPQVGNSVTGVMLGGQPDTHNDRLFVFTHKKLTSAQNPTGTTCGQCHQRAYCQNCHSTGALKVTHDAMLYNHAAVIRQVGGQACAYCHQTAYCATCHGNRPVLLTTAEPADRPQAMAGQSP